MSARNSMYHRCTIQRDQSLSADSTNTWGGDNAPMWRDYKTNVSCRFWFQKGSTIMQGERRVDITQRWLMLPITTVVTAEDRIAFVTDRRGRVVATGPMRIDSIGARVDHLLVKMVEVK